MAEIDYGRTAALARAALGESNGHLPNQMLKILEEEPVPINLAWVPPVLAAYADDQAEIWQESSDQHVLCGLAVILAAVGQNVQLVLPGGDTVPASDYFMLVGDSGTGKSPIMTKWLRPLKDRQEELNEAYKARKRVFESAKAAGGPEAKHAGERPVSLAVVHDNSTFEALIMDLALAPDTGSLWYADELIGLFNSISTGKGTGLGRNLTDLLTMWRADPIRRRRKTEHELSIVNRPTVSILGSIHPDRLHLLGDNVDGRLARFLVIPLPEESKGSIRDPEPVHAKLWGDLVRNVLDTRPLALQTLGLTDPAADLWRKRQQRMREFVAGLPEPDRRFIRPFASKLEQHVGRLVIAIWAGIMGRAWELPAVDRKIVADAWEMGAGCLLRHQARIFAPGLARGGLKPWVIDEADAVRHFHALLTDRFHSPVTLRQVRDGLKRHFDSPTLTATVKAWVSAGLGRVVKEGSSTFLEWDGEQP